MDPNLPNSNNQPEQPVSNVPIAPTPHIVIPPPPEQVQNPVLPQPVSLAPPIQQPQQTAVPPEKEPPQEKKSHKKIVVGLLILLVLLLSLSLTVYLVKQQQQSHTNATGNTIDTLSDNSPIASYNGDFIYKKDLDNFLTEQSGSGPYSEQAYKDALDILIERKILDAEAKDKNIAVSQDEIDSKASFENISQETARYEILKDKVIMLEVNARRAVVIGFWSPPGVTVDQLTSDQIQQLNDGSKALAEIQSGLEANQDSITLTVSMLDPQKYPSLKPVLALNGYIFDKLSDAEKQNLAVAQIYEYGASNFDQMVLDGLFGMEVNQVKTFQNTESNGGGNVFKLLEVGNKNGPASYDLWLAQQKSSDKLKIIFTL